MKSVSELNGLQDLRTVTSQRIRATPPARGSAYLNTYLLSLERLRLDQELALLEKRRHHLLTKRAEVVQHLSELHEKARMEIAGEATNGAAAPLAMTDTPPQRRHPWKTVPLGY